MDKLSYKQNLFSEFVNAGMIFRFIISSDTFM